MSIESNIAQISILTYTSILTDRVPAIYVKDQTRTNMKYIISIIISVGVLVVVYFSVGISLNMFTDVRRIDTNLMAFIAGYIAFVISFLKLNRALGAITNEKFSDIFTSSPGWAFGVAFLVFILFIFVFVGNLGPIPALIYTPIAFFVSLVVSLIIKTLLAAYSRH